LKQYNNRWIVFGNNEAFGTIQNLALDRIEGVKMLNNDYIENREIDFYECFEEFIGFLLVKTKRLLKLS